MLLGPLGKGHPEVVVEDVLCGSLKRIQNRPQPAFGSIVNPNQVGCNQRVAGLLAETAPEVTGKK